MRTHEDDDDDHRGRELDESPPPLPERELLEAWVVPEPAPDLAERVMAHVDAALASGETSEQREGAVSMDERRRGGYGWALVGVAMVAAAALVLGFVQLWRAEPRVAAPVVVTVPVPVPVASTSPEPTPPAPPPAPAEEATDEVEAKEAPQGSSERPDLEDPFRVEPAREEPEATPPKPTSKAPRGHRDLKDPFASRGDAAKTVTLRIGTESGYGPAKVHIDGKYMGMTPLMSIKVAPGRHTVKFAWSDGESETSSFTVEDGQTRTLEGPMKQRKDPYGGR